MLGNLPGLLQDLQLSSSSLLTASQKVAGLLSKQNHHDGPQLSSASASSSSGERSLGRDSDQGSSSLPTSEADGEAFTEGAASGNSATSPPKTPPPELIQQAELFAKESVDLNGELGSLKDEEKTELEDDETSQDSCFRFEVPDSLRINPMFDPLFHARMLTRMSAPTFQSLNAGATEESVQASHQPIGKVASNAATLSHHGHTCCAHDHDTDIGDSCEDDECDCRGEIAYMTSGNNKKRKSARHAITSSGPSSSATCSGSHGRSDAHVSSAGSTWPQRNTEDEDIDEDDHPRVLRAGPRSPHSALPRLNVRSFVKMKYRAFRASRAKAKAKEEEERRREEEEREEEVAAAAAAAAAAARKKRSSKAESKARAMGKSNAGKKMTLSEIKAMMKGQQNGSAPAKTAAKDGRDAAGSEEKAPQGVAATTASPKADEGVREYIEEQAASQLVASVKPPERPTFDYVCSSESTNRLLTMRKEIDNLQSTLSDSLRPIDDAVAAATDALARIDAGDPDAAASAAAALAAARAALPEPYMRSITGPQAQWNSGILNTSAARLAKLLPSAESTVARAQAFLANDPKALPSSAPIAPPSAPIQPEALIERRAPSPAAQTVPAVPSPPSQSPVQRQLSPEQSARSPLPNEGASSSTARLPAPSEEVPPVASPSAPSARSPSPPQPQNPPKISRRKKANMNNVHHKSNYVPSRTPAEAPRNRPLAAPTSTHVPAGCLDHPTTSNQLFPDEWVCLFCDYELLYGEPPLMLRALKSRKKIARTRKRAQERAHAAATGNPMRPPAHNHTHDCDSEADSIPRCECGNPLCYEDDPPAA